MSPAFKAFNDQLGAFVRQVMPDELSQVTRLIALDLFTRLVQKTPVDTGRARAGWQLLINEAPTADSGFSPGDKGNFSNAPASTAHALATAQANLAAVAGKDIKSIRIFIGNPVFYIVYLDQGSSKQAPLGITDQALQETSSSFFGV